MKILILDGKMQNFDTYIDLFKSLVKDDYVVEKIDNGTMFLTKGEDKIEAQYGELNKENSINPFSEEIVAYRESLRGASKTLMDFGIKIDQEELAHVKRIFEFLG